MDRTTINPIRFQAKAGDKAATLDVIGIFDGWEINEAAFAATLHSLDPKAEININLNSPGGEVTIALAMYNLLKEHQGAINIKVLGWACSAATILTSLPNAHVRMGVGSVLMVHNPWTVAVGDHDELRHAADTTEKWAASLAEIYAVKTGKDLNSIRDLMDAETWFTASEAVAEKFADSLDEAEKVAACVTGDHVIALGGVAFNFGGRKAPPLDCNGGTNMSKQEQAAGQPKATAAQPQMTVEALLAEYPDLIRSIVDKAVATALTDERARMQALDDLATPSCKAAIHKAKYETFVAADKAAYEILMAERQAQAKAAQALVSDASELATSVQDINAAAPDAAASSENLMQQDINAWTALAENVAKQSKRI